VTCPIQDFAVIRKPDHAGQRKRAPGNILDEPLHSGTFVSINARAGVYVKARALSRRPVLIKAVFEVDTLKCPKCGGAMKIISFIEEEDVIRKILKRCNLWKEPAPGSPPKPEEKPHTRSIL